MTSEWLPFLKEHDRFNSATLITIGQFGFKEESETVEALSKSPTKHFRTLS